MKITKIFSTFSSKLIKRLTQFAPTGEFPDYKKTIEHFKVSFFFCFFLKFLLQKIIIFFKSQNSFDFEEALKEGVVAPAKGVDQEYDSIQKKIKEIEEELADYLKQQEKYFGVRLQYVGKDKNRFEIEVPEHACKKADNRYNLEGQRKGKNAVRRFSTNETRELLAQLLEAEGQRNSVLRDLLRRMFAKFSDKYDVWKKVIDCVAILDCLTAFAVYGQNQNQVCFPEIVDTDEGPIIEIEDGYHPCMKLTEDFIPNGITLGGKNAAPLALLTGPNMVNSLF